MFGINIVTGIKQPGHVIYLFFTSPEHLSVPHMNQAEECVIKRRLVTHELRVASCELRVTSCELVLSTSCVLRVDSAKCELVHLKCELRVQKKILKFPSF